ncbi:MAG: polyribonucleotide nucleotidyltransferase [Bacteroidetes bacterium]|nr:polyribonucleotide nucleotidyltransferase [Bacteroidota bacterium]
MQAIIETLQLEDGRTITIETGKLAKQADGSVVVRMGNTMLLATVVANREVKEGQDFFPLSVEYKEKFSADGRMPGGFIKRENRPNELEILTCRLVDRALRPLFPEDYLCECQVIISLISYEIGVLPDALACLAASAALAVSDIPFNGPVSEVKVGRVDGKFVLNPTAAQLEVSDIDMMIAASIDNVIMVEGEMLEISEAEMLEAISFAHAAIKLQCQAQLNLAAKIEKSKVKREYAKPASDLELKARIDKAAYDKVYAVAKLGWGKHERSAEFKKVYEEVKATFTAEELAVQGKLIKTYFHDVEYNAVRRLLLDEQRRLDGRKPNQIRAIWSEVDYLPSAHGSAIFTRGETQSLTSVTLGTKLDEQKMDAVSVARSEKFYLHYNFPPFSTGEAKMLRGTSRREVGHGNLAQRALKPVIPTGEENPYTIRVVSDILESNGSSSMATVCAGTLALMDAGVQIKAPVSGIAMGLIADKTGKFEVLSDILGDEDHLGDMDFKVTGTTAGITACQMDIKIEGLSFEILTKALHQAKEGRLHILGEMAKTISAPKSELKPHAPRMVSIFIDAQFIGMIIGPGGKHIQELQKTSGTVITIEELEKTKQGKVSISGSNADAIQQVVSKIKGMTTAPEVGETYEGKVKTVLAFGAVVEILPGKEGLLHISEFDHRRIEDINTVVKEGDILKVKLLEIEAKSGKLKLSRKALIPKPERATEAK